MNARHALRPMGERPRVAFVLPDLGGGGAQRVMLTFARHLDPWDFDLHLIPVGRDEALAAMVPEDVPVHRLHALRLRTALPGLVRTIRALRPAAVVSTIGYVNLGLLAARSLLGTNTCIVVREANVLKASWNALPRLFPGRWAYRIFYPRAAAIIAPTQTIAAEIGQAAPGAAARIAMLPNPVDVDALRRSASPATRPAGSGLALVGAGRLVRQKGFDRLIALMPDLPADTTLTIYGEGPDRGALQAQIDALGLSGRVTLPGFSDRLAAAIAGADIFVLPSRWEGLPNVVLEALALGTPVVASTEAGVDDIARGAPQGALTIAPVDRAFSDVIRCHVGTAAAAPRASLLPDEHGVDRVAKRFADLIRGCIAASVR